MGMFGFSDPYSGFPDAFQAGDMRRDALWNGITQMGLNIMNPDPNLPPSLGRSIGRGLSGLSQGVDQGRQEYEQRGLTTLKMQEYQVAQASEKRKQEALTELLADSDLDPSLRNWIMANPDHAWDVIKPQFEKPKDIGKMSPGEQYFGADPTKPLVSIPAEPKAPNLITVVSPDGTQRRSIDVTDPKARSFLQPYLDQGWTEAGGAGGSAQDEYGLQPIVTQDADGKYHLFQANKGGGPPKEIPLPYGWTPQQQYLDLGTGFQAAPKQGTGPGVNIPKDVAGEAAQKAAGGAQGTAGAELPAAIVDATRTVQKIDELLADPSLASATGWQGYVPDKLLPFVPGAGVSAYNARTKINQLHGRAFMDAYATLKGGGVITEIEGAKATDALARINAPGISDADYVVALKDFRDAVQTGLEKIAARAGATAPNITAPPAERDDRQPPAMEFNWTPEGGLQ